MPKGQGWEAQEQRLDNGCCPVHGIPMYQAGGWYRLPGEEQAFTIVSCTRADCDVHSTETEPFGRAKLLPQNEKVYGYHAEDYPEEGEAKSPYEIWPGHFLRLDL